MKYVAAIDLGTSKIAGMIARKEGDELTVLAVEREDTSSSVKRGYVHNIGELALKIKRILKKLENQFGKPIASVYVNVNGQSLRTEDNTITYSMRNDETITQELLDKLQKDAAKKSFPSEEVLEVVDPEYFINSVREISPVGVSCSQIECRYKLIVGKPNFKKNINKCFAEISGVEIAGYLTSPLSSAVAVLSDKDKELGCALVEFGAGVTSLSVYKNNLLRLLVTVPFGGENVTRDIQSLNVTAGYAEKLKFEIADASNPQNVEKGKKVRLQSAESAGDVPEIEVRKLNECVYARENEIIVNVLNQLKESGYNDKLGSGIIIAGGASEMRGLQDLFKSLTQHEVKKADLMLPIDSTGMNNVLSQPGYEQISGMLWLSEKSCLREIPETPNTGTAGQGGTQPAGTQPVTPPVAPPTGRQTGKGKKGILDRLSNKFSGFLFEEEDTDFKDDEKK